MEICDRCFIAYSEHQWFRATCSVYFYASSAAYTRSPLWKTTSCITCDAIVLPLTSVALNNNSILTAVFFNHLVNKHPDWDQLLLLCSLNLFSNEQAEAGSGQGLTALGARAAGSTSGGFCQPRCKLQHARGVETSTSGGGNWLNFFWFCCSIKGHFIFLAPPCLCD